jgi:ABC-type cobalt transport system substrate-binding protein
MSMGLHKEASWKTQDPVTREVWRRICWALYTAEVFGAMSFGTPCNINDSDWSVSFPINIDDTSSTCPGFSSIEVYEGESLGPVTIASYQRYKFRLYRIASTITTNVYLHGGATLSQVVDEIKTINQRLLQWEKWVPPELRLKYVKSDNPDPLQQKTVRIFQLQAVALQLSYDNIQLVLHRPLLTINRVPRPLTLESRANSESNAGAEDTFSDTIDAMIKTSKYHCWVSSMSTSKIGEYGSILAALQNTHGAAYAGIQSFTAGAVLGIFALSDPLSDQAHQAKRAVSRIIKLPRLHRFRTTVSDQCGAILEELVRLVLAEEMKALLNEGDASRLATAQGGASHDPVAAAPDESFAQDGSDIAMQGAEVADQGVADVFELFSHETLELPRDIASGNFSDALVSLQDGMTSLRVVVCTQADLVCSLS